VRDPDHPDDAAAPPVRASAYLLPGHVQAARTPTAISTVLGSCVAVCLHDPAAGIGGMNHFLLPHPVSEDRSSRFGNVAVAQLVAAVEREGALRARLVAKVFGGAAVNGVPPGSRRPLGEENVRAALLLLEDLGVPVQGGDVGGDRGRRLVFHTDTGRAWVRLL
jgi:chemotaxis protein CheD